MKKLLLYFVIFAFTGCENQVDLSTKLVQFSVLGNCLVYDLDCELNGKEFEPLKVLKENEVPIYCYPEDLKFGDVLSVTATSKDQKTMRVVATDNNGNTLQRGVIGKTSTCIVVID